MLTPAQRAVIEGSPPGRALTGVTAPAHDAIWRQGGAAGIRPA